MAAVTTFATIVQLILGLEPEEAQLISALINKMHKAKVPTADQAIQQATTQVNNPPTS